VQEDPAELANLNMMRDDLNHVMLTLSERECGILKMRYGLDDGHEKTLEEVGRAFNVRQGQREGESSWCCCLLACLPACALTAVGWLAGWLLGVLL
jgi:hypothetical protein